MSRSGLADAMASARAFLLTLPDDHPLKERLMFDFSTLTDEVHKLRTDRDAQKARADAQQKRADDLDAKLADVDKQGAALLAELTGQGGDNVLGQAGVNPNDGTITASVTAPTPSASTVVPVAQVSVGDIATAVDTATAAGTTVSVSGPGIADGSTVVAVDPVASTVTLSHPTEVDHVGDGSEMLTITPPAPIGKTAAGLDNPN